MKLPNRIHRLPKYRDDSSRRVAARLITVLALLLVIIPSAVGATGDTNVPTADPASVVPAPFNTQMSWSQEGAWHWVNLAYTGDNTTVGTPVPHASYVATLVLTLDTTQPCATCVTLDDQNEGPPTILDGSANPQLAPAYADLDNGPRHQQTDGSWPIGAWYLNYSPTSHAFFSWTWIPGVAQSPTAQVAQFGTVATSVGASERVFPLAGSYTETQPFGCVAADPGYPTVAACPPDTPSFHDGVDLGAKAGTPIVAAASGTVVFAGLSSDKPGANSQIIIQHDGANAGYQTMYLHWEKAFVHAGEHVRAGQEIALVGSVGYSTGPHLHFTVFDASGNAIDPLGWLKGATVASISTASVSVSDTAGVLQWQPLIAAAAKQYGVPSAFIAAIVTIESSGDPSAVSVVGAQGLLQVMPAELARLGVAHDKWLDPATNIAAGARLMAAQLANGASLEDVAASYFGQGCDAYGTCTAQYVARVMAWDAYYEQLFAGQPATLVLPPAATQTTQLASQSTTTRASGETTSGTPPMKTSTPNPAPSEQAAVNVPTQSTKTATAATTPKATPSSTATPQATKTTTPTPATVAATTPAATASSTTPTTPSPTSEPTPTSTSTPQSTASATPTKTPDATATPSSTATSKATTTKLCPVVTPAAGATATSTPAAKSTTTGCTPPPCPANATTDGKDGQPSATSTATPTVTPSATPEGTATAGDQGCVPPCSASVTADGTPTPTPSATATPAAGTCDVSSRSATPEATSQP